MTTFAIATGSALMHVGMARVAIGFGLFEFQCGMTLPATDSAMLSDRRKLCFVVVKPVFLYFIPVIGCVAGCTFHGHLITVRRFGMQECDCSTK